MDSQRSCKWTVPSQQSAGTLHFDQLPTLLQGGQEFEAQTLLTENILRASAARLICYQVICLHIFASSMLTQLLCSFLSSFSTTTEHSASSGLSLSFSQGSTRLLRNPKFHYRAHKSPSLDPSSTRWLQIPKSHTLVSVRSVVVGSFNLLKTKRNLPYIRNQFVPRSKHFTPRL